MPTIRRPGSPPPDPHAPAPASAAPGAPQEHSLLPLQVPEDTTPTWELEMLVSGAVLVGLFQLPPVIDGALRSLIPRLSTQLGVFLAGIGYMYVKGMMYALMVTFVVHLVARAYWVAMVGLDSVFPQGVRWENERRYGPIMKDLIRDRVPTLPRTISALDNFCSVLFAVGFIAVSLGLLSLALFSLGGLITWAVAAAFFGGAYTEWILVLVVWILILPVLLMALDRRLGARLRPEGRAAALLRGILRLSLQSAAIRLYGPSFLTFFTNVRRRVVLTLVFVLLFGSMAFAFSDMLHVRGSVVTGVDPGLPSSLQRAGADYRHYADQRTGDALFARVPFIQSDVVRDPYVRLFVPYDARQDAGELKGCMQRGGGVAAHAAAVAAQVAERCLAALYAVRLDGRARTDLDYRFYTDVASGLQGLLVYIPVEGLPHGRHLLAIRRPRLDDEGRRLPAGVTSILFWL